MCCESLAKEMVGREVIFRTERSSVDLGGGILNKESLSALSDKGLLAFDDVYEVDGTYRGSKQEDVNEDDIYTTLYISNDHARELSQSNSKLLFGLSFHPFRDCAIDKLEAYHEDAVLCKWLPSAQMIDLSEENAAAQAKLIPFYEKLVEIKLPLLLHTGIETGVPSAKESYKEFNRPKYSKTALNKGVTVILAHCGCSYIDYLQDNYVEEVIELFGENNPPNLRLHDP